MRLQADIRHKFDGIAMNAQFDLGPGITAIFGRSGAGKTTVVDAIAGLWAPDFGRITLDDTPLLDTQNNVNVPAHSRRMGYVFQDGRLFPHLSVQQNLDFGVRYGANRAAKPDGIIELLGLESLMNRRPATLSGGEKQRVAIGRALLCQPQLLLMDEPLAALDHARKQEILPYLERLQQGATSIPILYVSHAIDEIARIADHLLLLDSGRIAASGPVFDVLADPAMVPILGVQEAGAVIRAVVTAHAEDGISTLQTSMGALELPKVNAEIGTRVRLRVRAQDVILSRERPSGMSSSNILPVTITSVHSGDGPGAAIALQSGDDQLLTRVTSRAVQDLQLQVGMSCFAIVNATAIARGSISSGR